MKYKVACWFAIAAAWTCLAAAQSSQTHLSSPVQSPDPLKSATRPLTAKSAAPAQHKSSVVMPQKPASKENTNAELSRLERQKTVLSNNPKSVTPSSTKNTSSPKSAGTSASASAPIDYKYHEPVGGRQADTPNARTPNSTTPRVTKKN
jgi:hypothetical protein